jgi:anthranilate phosphoribosyltransferase
VPVVKHGNRAATSSCGSADLLETLGYPMGASPEQLAADLQRRRFAFLFAPAFHPLLGSLKEIRTRLGIPTVFNLLGPLLNPARPAYQVLGVARADLLDPMAGALAGLGLARAFVVHGEDAGGRGLDEASIEGKTLLVEVRQGVVLPRVSFHPKDLGIPKPEPQALVAATRAEAVEAARGSIGGASHPAHRAAVADAVALQAALGLLLYREAPLASLPEAYREARAALQVGFDLPFEVS